MSRLDEAFNRLARERGQRADRESSPANPAGPAGASADADAESPWDVSELAAEPDVTLSADEGAPGEVGADLDAAEAPILGFDANVAEKLVVAAKALPLSVEQYRRLAATLHHAQAERAIKVVMICSALAGEGKTLTSTNLALTLSESYRRRVLLVDADLRRPALHEVFQLPNVSGLTDGLKADAARSFPVVQVSPHLAILTAGRPDPDPMSGLTSGRMRQVIREAAERYDWVIVDTPPVGLLPDANLLAAMVDAVVLVVQAGATPFHLVQRAVEALGRDRVIGVVLNRAADDAVESQYRYYSYDRRYASRT